MYEYKIREILRVVDGDTIDVILDLGLKSYVEERLRLDKIDTPDYVKAYPETKLYSDFVTVQVDGWLRDRFDRGILVAKTKKNTRGKEIKGGRGRYLASIEYIPPTGERELLDEFLLENRFALPYMKRRASAVQHLKNWDIVKYEHGI